MRIACISEGVGAAPARGIVQSVGTFTKGIKQFVQRGQPICFLFVFVCGLNCGMEISFNTPALLFPAISLLLLAYTNRFLALANLVRKLHDEYTTGQRSKIILRQIHSLRRRINLIRYMQALGVFSFLCCVASMYSIYKGWGQAAEYIFALSLLSLLSSLIFSLAEIIQSTNAIELELSDMEELEKSNIFTDLLSRKGNEEKP